ncbi:hypothetical protein MUG84_22915 [Paenibacillus sp. KQZ6P-2]|uniref:Uncharacterized protein n=1 Tax=Paenibacillus mangrovi TaxID=2931978 RepID=A0A9X1WVI8_9BACL|nr:hypothetical protein [Paenibacillus mangrovi]MCJ8014555.1 hypothetical protein [Paenibacillus mangrovi]
MESFVDHIHQTVSCLGKCTTRSLEPSNSAAFSGNRMLVTEQAMELGWELTLASD